MSPEFAESVLLALAAGWLYYLGRRARPMPRALLFASLYLAIPACVLAGQAAGVDEWIDGGKWVAVVANAALLVAMVVATRRPDSPTVAALVDAERELRRRELRARAHALAAVVLAPAA